MIVSIHIAEVQVVERFDHGEVFISYEQNCFVTDKDRNVLLLKLWLHGFHYHKLVWLAVLQYPMLEDYFLHLLPRNQWNLYSTHSCVVEQCS